MSASSTAHHAAQLAAIVEASDDAIIGKSIDGTILSWNPGAERLFGYRADEIVGQSILLLIPPGREHEERLILAAVTAGETKRFETVRRRKDGRDVDVSVTTSPIRDASGAVVGVSKVARDITSQRRARDALASARDDAQAVSKELEAFSYSVAHDLRAPLRAMNGFSRALLEKYESQLDDEGRDWLGEIQHATTKMASLIDGLLALSRVTQSAAVREETDLSELAREILDRLQATEPERVVERHVDDGLRASVDPRLARSLLENLLGNAWRFTSRTPRARIAVGAAHQDSRQVFFVRDNGAGFDMALGHKLFGAFQRLHTADDFPGTGIGLATVRRIVQRHGGRTWAEGQVERGATFYFTLPPSVADGCS